MKTRLLPKEPKAMVIRALIRTMRMRSLPATLLVLVLYMTGYAQTLNKATLDQFFDRLAEKNKAMGSLIIAKSAGIIFEFDAKRGQMTQKRAGRERVLTKEN